MGYKVIAVIGLRSGSKGVQNKNIRMLGGSTFLSGWLRRQKNLT